MTLLKSKLAVEAEFHIFVMSALDEFEWSPSLSSLINPAKGDPLTRRRLR